MRLERASKTERTTGVERASSIERINERERAIDVERAINRERANGAERTNAAKRAILEDRITTLERAMNDVERPLDPPEAWGCEYCNPESLDKEAELFPCGNRGPMFFCSRPEGHDDEHAYCVAYQHPLRTWR